MKFRQDLDCSDNEMARGPSAFARLDGQGVRPDVGAPDPVRVRDDGHTEFAVLDGQLPYVLPLAPFICISPSN